MSDWIDCQSALGLSFSDELLLEQAFTHPSYLNENPDFALPCNERLEFLGDAVLDFIVAEKLFREFPKLPEGELTSIRASLVCRETLAEIAASLNLGDYLLLGQGEKVSGGRTRTSNLANVLEALIGAIYIDQGMVRAREFVLKRLESELSKIKAGKMTPNYKALLQEFVQGEKKSTPVYRLVGDTGPDHNKRFMAEVLIDGEIQGKGMGKSKKAAEVQAAKVAWRKVTGRECLPIHTAYLAMEIKKRRFSHHPPII